MSTICLTSFNHILVEIGSKVAKLRICKTILFGKKEEFIYRKVGSEKGNIIEVAY